jgi:PAS domain S-box-containing protein
MQPSAREVTRLCDFLRERQEDILAQWERAVSASWNGADALPAPVLRDHIPAMLDRIAEAVRTAQDPRAPRLGDLAERHALDRLATGFDLRSVASELALLRDVALRLWEPRSPGEDAATIVREIRRFNQAVDEVIAGSVDRYARARERTLVALDRVSSAALGTGHLEQFLPRLLEVLLETTATADSAYILLRDDGSDVFRIRAAAGPQTERSVGFAVRVGEGVAGEVALRREPMLVRDASSDPRVLNPALRGQKVHALYVVPLVHQGEVVGVAKLASRSAYEFSGDDQHLFLAMAQRATSIIVQAQLLAREREALRTVSRSEEELRTVMQVSPDMLAIVDADGFLKRVNPAFTGVLGYSEAELLGTPYREFVHPEDRDRVEAELKKVLAGRPAHRLELRMLRKGGAVRWVSFNASAEPGTDLFVAVGRDVTEERRRSEFEQQLIGIVSHDLRNPLSTILMASTVLVRRADEIDERTYNAIGRIHSAAERASALIRDLLDFTKARTAGGILIRPQPLDLHAVARRASQDVHVVYADRSLTIEQQGEAEGFWDPARIAQVIENLVSNAFKYGAPDRPVVVRTLGGERWIRLEVHNRGPPIDPALLPHIFEPLRQGRERAPSGAGASGVGLGLYIVDHIVRAHGGTIDVHSSAAEGTTFIVRLPREPPLRAE